jgi:hypothetical protein
MSKSILPHEKLSLEERKLRAIENKINHAIRQLQEVTQEAFDLVWDEPAQMISAQGTRAKANFEDHAQTVNYLLQMGINVPVKYQAAPQAYTVHDDGTITLA